MPSRTSSAGCCCACARSSGARAPAAHLMSGLRYQRQGCIPAYHAVAHFERRLLSRLREELRRACPWRAPHVRVTVPETGLHPSVPCRRALRAPAAVAPARGAQARVPLPRTSCLVLGVGVRECRAQVGHTSSGCMYCMSDQLPAIRTLHCHIGICESGCGQSCLCFY